MNINHLVKKAVKENKVKELLQGEGEYYVGFDSFVGAVAPTDWTIIIPELYKINKEEPQWNVSKLFENTLIDLFNGSPREIFVGVGAMYVQILREEGNRADFFIDRKTILSLCKKALMREELRDSYIVVQNIQLSIWPEIERYAMLLKKKWKIEVIQMRNTRDISLEIQMLILNGAKIPHSTSQPVIYQEKGKYYLAIFVFFYTKEDIETGTVERPSVWAIADIETGEIIEERQTKEIDFSDASYDAKYNVRSDAQYDTSKKYYDDAFAILDSVREKIISTGKLYKLEYKYYLDKILANIPKDYQRFYTDLSV